MNTVTNSVMNPVMKPVMKPVMNPVTNPSKNPVLNPVVNPTVKPVMNRESHLLTTSGLVFTWICLIAVCLPDLEATTLTPVLANCVHFIH